MLIFFIPCDSHTLSRVCLLDMLCCACRSLEPSTNITGDQVLEKKVLDYQVLLCGVFFIIVHE